MSHFPWHRGLTGFAFIPMVGLIAIASYFGGKITSVIGPRWPMTIGLGISAVGFLAMLIATINVRYIALILPMAAMSFGIAFMQPASTVAAIHSAPQNRAGIASGTFNASRQVGSLLGVALFGTILNSTSSFLVGMRYSLILGGMMLLISCLMAFIYVKT